MTFNGRFCHWLNIIFNLPHPGPNDIQGPCGCREKEGPAKHSFKNYLEFLGTGKEPNKGELEE